MELYETDLDSFYKVTQDLHGVTRDHVSTLDCKWLHRASETGTYTLDESTLSNKKRQQSQAAASRIYLVTSLRNIYIIILSTSTMLLRQSQDAL